MTHRAGNGDSGIPRIWLLPIVLIGALIFLTASGVLSQSIVIDLLAWWPVWLILVGLGVFGWSRKIRGVRLSGITPLLVTVALLVFSFGHVQGWPGMPSAAQSLVGPETEGYTSAALSGRITGQIELAGGSDFLYRVDPIRRGGDQGVPSASEQIQDSAISVVLNPPEDPGLYQFAGWEVSLATTPTWDLTLEGELDADLTALSMNGLQASGEGDLALGRVDETVTATISGVFNVSVPAGSPVRVIGDANVPSSWEVLGDGHRSPADGDGWVISVPEGSSVTVIER